MYLSTPGIMLYGSRCKAAEFIGDKQTHKQTYKHSTFFYYYRCYSVCSSGLIGYRYTKTENIIYHRIWRWLRKWNAPIAYTVQEDGGGAAVGCCGAGAPTAHQYRQHPQQQQQRVSSQSVHWVDDDDDGGERSRNARLTAAIALRRSPARHVSRPTRRVRLY